MKQRHADQTKHIQEKAELEFKLMRLQEQEGGMSDSGSESSDGGVKMQEENEKLKKEVQDLKSRNQEL